MLSQLKRAAWRDERRFEEGRVSPQVIIRNLKRLLQVQDQPFTRSARFPSVGRKGLAKSTEFKLKQIRLQLERIEEDQKREKSSIRGGQPDRRLSMDVRRFKSPCRLRGGRLRQGKRANRSELQ